MSDSTRYCIIANPASGIGADDERYELLKGAADILSAKVYGLDTTCAGELALCAREQAENNDVLVVAGGDGTFSLVVNAVDLSATTLAFLPFGTGNALTHALTYRGGISRIAHRIRTGSIHFCDLIDCDSGKKAFMVSLGVDGEVIRLYEEYRSLGYRGLKAHVPAAFNAIFRHYRPTGCNLSMDGEGRRIDRLWSLMVVKQPFFGMGLKAVPRALWDDGKLHVKVLASGFGGIAAGLITGFTIGNLAGEYKKGEKLTVRLDDPLTLQVDGELGWTGDRFSFAVLPRILRLKH